MTLAIERRRAGAVALAGLAITLVLGALSDGVHHDDDLTHFLMARWAGSFPLYLVHIWARPGFTIPYAMVAWIGDAATAWHLCRGLSALFSFAAVMVAVRVAERLDARPLWAVAAACYMQPMFVLLGATTLTENVAAFYLVAAAALMMLGRTIGASAVFSLVLVTRYETAALLPIWWAAVAVEERKQRSATRGRDGSASKSMIARTAAAVVVSVGALLAHWALLAIFVGARPWQIYAQPSGSTEFTAGGLTAFVPAALMAVPAALAGLAVVGAAKLAWSKRWLAPALAAAYFLIHALIRSGGLYASGGYARFMVVVAPLIAIAAVASRPWAGSTDRRRAWIAVAAVFLVGAAAVQRELAAGRIRIPDERLRMALMCGALALGVAALAAGVWPTRGRRVIGTIAGTLLAAALVVQWGAIVRPLRKSETARTVGQIVRWIDERGLVERPIFATSPWVAFERNLAESPRHRKGPRLLASMPIGTIVVWDRVYSPNDYHQLPLTAIAGGSSYRLLRTWPIDDLIGSADFCVFEKVAATPVPGTEPIAYPPDLMGTAEPRGWYYLDPGRRHR